MDKPTSLANASFLEDADFVAASPESRRLLVAEMRVLSGRAEKRRRAFLQIKPIINDLRINHARSFGEKGNKVLTDLIRDVEHRGVDWPIAAFLAWMCAYLPDDAIRFYCASGLAAKLGVDYRRYIGGPQPKGTHQKVVGSIGGDVAIGAHFISSGGRETSPAVVPLHGHKDVEIAYLRIADEIATRSGRLTLANLDIDFLPGEVLQLGWLQYLDFCRSAITYVQPLSRLRNLKTLDCSYNPLVRLPSIEGCESLHTLWCGVTEIDSLVELEACEELQILYCGRTKINNLSYLKQCKKLRNLHCDDTDVSSLNGLEELHALELVDCLNTAISTITQLSVLPKLETLILSGCHLTDSGIQVWKMPSLKTVFFDRGSIRGVPRSVLSGRYDDNCLPRLRRHFGVNVDF